MEEYKVIKVKIYEDSPSSHHLFYKKHKISKNDSKESHEFNSKTLFVNNVPPYFNEQGLKNIFNTFGIVDHVLIYSNPISNPFSKLNMNNKKKQYNYDEENIEQNCFKVAYVIFNQEQSVEKAIKKPLVDKEKFLLNNKESPLSTGMKKWIESYRKNFVDAKKISNEIENYMLIYDETKAKKEIEESEKMNQPDEDGWLTVTPKNRKSNLAFTERNIEKLKLKQKKKRQQMQLLNFYSFQMKESKKEYIAQLRKKFEEDKKRIETMKQNRKFKPF